MRWLRRMFQKPLVEQQMDAELRFHLEQQAEEYVASGLSMEEARRRARLEFGGLDRVKEECRDIRWEVRLESLGRGFRLALRSLGRDRRVAVVAIFALALGIGATTVMFSVIYNVIFDPLPYKDFNRSVVITMHGLTNIGGWKGRIFFSMPEFLAFREQNHVLEEIIGHYDKRVFYDDGKFTRGLSARSITTNTFDYFGVLPLLGRGFTAEDGKPGAPPVFVMNYRLWQREFGGDPNILGTTLLLNGKEWTLVGIMPLRFNAYRAGIWLPANLDSDGPMLELMGRLKPGVSAQTAAAELDAIEHRVQKINPKGIYPDKFAIEAKTLLDSLLGDFKKALYALLAAVFLLLLIACSNVANLLLTRATAREREMALRASLGATRGRLVRQLLVESFVLAAAAGVAGCVLAYFSLKVVVVLIPPGTIPEETVIRMNAPVLLLSLGIIILTTLLCGLAPALHVVRGDLQPRLTGSAKGVGGSLRHGRLRAGLVITEVALSTVLLIGAGLLLRSFFILTHVDLGFDPKNVLYLRLSLPTSYDHSRKKQNVLTRQVLERMRTLPGVTSVAESSLLPPLTYDWSETIIPGKPHVERWETRYEICSEGYFETLGVQLLRGRVFSEGDVEAARHVMVVSQAFARQYFPNEDPLGQRVKLEVLDRPFLDAPHDTYFEIIGVVSDYKTRDLRAWWQAVPQAFIPYSVQGFSWRTYTARSAVDANSLLKNITREVRAIDPNVGIAASGTIEGSLRDFYRKPQFELFTLGAFASVGLMLVVIGIFSVMAYTVSLQTHEIGIRMALGAQQTDILRMVLLKGLRLIAGGIVIGLLVSYGATRFLASQISGVSVTDPWTFGVVAGVVLGVGLVACYLPARRAVRIDPMLALRYE